MSLSPEERSKIYEEEKAKVESSQKATQGERTLKDLKPENAGLLCYLGFWITGIVFLVLEKKDRLIRFHAIQSIIVFGFLHIVGLTLSSIPFIGPFFGAVALAVALVLWVVLMIKASQGQLFIVPGAGELAWRLLGSEPTTPATPPTPPAPAASPVPTTVPRAPAAAAPPQTQAAAIVPPPPPTPPAPPAVQPVPKAVKADRSGRGYAGRMVASAFAIAWSVALLVFLNFFNSYIAFYHIESSTWVREPLLTAEFSTWLPVVTTVLAITIAGHILLLAIDKYVLREGTLLILDIFNMMSAAALLAIFPFDFSPFGAIDHLLDLSAHLILAIIIFAVGIAVLVRLVKLIVNVARGAATY